MGHLKEVCPGCGHIPNRVFGVRLEGEICLRKFRCIVCDQEWESEFPLNVPGGQRRYIYTPEDRHRLTPLSRWVWREYNKRDIPPNAIIHHINGNPSDDRPLNLAALLPSSHYHTKGDIRGRKQQIIDTLRARVSELEEQLACKI